MAEQMIKVGRGAFKPSASLHEYHSLEARATYSHLAPPETLYAPLGVDTFVSRVKVQVRKAVYNDYSTSLLPSRLADREERPLRCTRDSGRTIANHGLHCCVLVP